MFSFYKYRSYIIIQKPFNMSILFSDHSAFNLLNFFCKNKSTFFHEFEKSWSDCKDRTKRENSATEFVNEIIQNLNCHIVNYIPENKLCKNLYTAIVLTRDNIPDVLGVKYDKYCLCYGTFTRWLYILFPCSIVDCVIIKNLFLENCDISDLVRIKAIKLLDTIEVY